MIVLRSLDEIPPTLRGGAVTIGNFDGVHRGHARLMERLLAAARRVGGPALAFTFDPAPSQILHPATAARPLIQPERKVELLAALGVDAVVLYPTNKAFLDLEPGVFFQQVLRERLGAKALVEGTNFSFGRKRAGNVDLLRRLTAEADMLFDVVEPVVVEGQIVSSSKIRELLAQGDAAAAGRLLGRPHRIRGTVVCGAGRGRQIGFPTANLDQVEVLLPADGVYAAQAEVGSTRYPAAVSLGPCPTFAENIKKIEVHLIGFQGWLEGRTLEVDFLARLREIKTFASIEALQIEIARDIDRTLAMNQ